MSKEPKIKEIKVTLEFKDSNGKVVTHECEFYDSAIYPLAWDLEAGARELANTGGWNVGGVNGFRRLMIYGKASK